MALAVTCALFAACSAEGAIDIELLWPNESLSPEKSDVFEITLVRNAAGEPTTRTVHRAPDPSGAVSLGRVEPGTDLRLAVELRSFNQRLLGYGRSQAGVDVAPGDSVTLSMNMRKPFLYMTGDTAISTYDPTIDTGDAGDFVPITALPTPLATATSSDGSALYVAHGTPGAYKLTLLATADHARPLQDPIDLDAAPEDDAPQAIAVSADGRYVALANRTGVTVVDIEERTVSLVDVNGPVDRVSVAPSGAPLAYALLYRNADCSIPQTSRVAALDLSDPQAPLGTLTLAESAQDIAAMPDRGAGPELLVASRCEDQVQGVNITTVETPTSEPFAQVTGVTALAVLDDRIWAVGNNPILDSAYLIAISLDFAGAQQSMTEFPVLQERAQTETFSGSGDESVRQMNADDVIAVHMGALPGGETLALTIESKFDAPERGSAIVLGIPVPILPYIEVTNREFLLVDVATATIAKRVRTDCDLDFDIPAALMDWECGRSADQGVTESEFVPTGLSILYGAN